MNIKKIAKSITPNILLKWRRNKYAHENIGRFNSNIKTTPEIKKDIQEKYGHQIELLDAFTNIEGALVHKWHHYIPLYEQYLSSFRGKK